MARRRPPAPISDFTAFYEDLNPLVQAQKKSGVLTSYDYKKDTQSVNWVTLLPSLLSVAMVFLLLMMMVRQNNANGGGGRPVPVRQGQIHLRRTDEEEGQLP